MCYSDRRDIYCQKSPEPAPLPPLHKVEGRLPQVHILLVLAARNPPYLTDRGIRVQYRRQAGVRGLELGESAELPPNLRQG